MGQPYCGWFHLSFDGNTEYNDGFWYEGWEGHNELVKLNLDNPDVRQHQSMRSNNGQTFMVSMVSALMLLTA